MKFILGKKENMTEYFSPEGKVFPVTIVKVDPVTVTKVFKKSKDGYDAVQIGFGKKKGNKISKGSGKIVTNGSLKNLKEFRLKTGDTIDVREGDTIDISIFSLGEKLSVSSVSKGKGFQGVVKRHNFSGGPRTHGQKHSEREPGSIGGGLRTHVPKGMKMAGRMGSDRITQKNLQVIFIDKETNILLIKGAIAGKRGTLVELVSR